MQCRSKSPRNLMVASRLSGCSKEQPEQQHWQNEYGQLYPAGDSRAAPFQGSRKRARLLGGFGGGGTRRWGVPHPEGRPPVRVVRSRGRQRLRSARRGNRRQIRAAFSGGEKATSERGHRPGASVDAQGSALAVARRRQLPGRLTVFMVCLSSGPMIPLESLCAGVHLMHPCQSCRARRRSGVGDRIKAWVCRWK
jgi:hypothetical protein